MLRTFVSVQSPQVQDATNGATLAPDEMEKSGYLIRPCIQASNVFMMSHLKTKCVNSNYT